ncbi:hypothetical protein C8R47DRAFT_1227465 [Mycena vitilis]|nr:hypothetical protein C8R47DRAFT_1227465 [Mycena vitilis]
MNNNEPPDESELPLSAVSQTDARLAIIDEEIAKLRERLNQLEDAPRGARPDILVTLPSVDDEWCRNKWDATDCLTHVSGFCRAVSLSTPSLWSRVAITYTPAHDPSSAYPLAMIEAQIRRSGSQKLTINFYGCEIVESGPRIQTSSCSQDTPNAGRNSTASSLVDVSIYHEHRFVSIPFPAHRLTRYQLDGPWATHDDLLRMASNLIEASMHLRRLYVSNWQFLDHIESPSLQKLALWIEEDDYAHVPGCLEIKGVRNDRDSGDKP